MVFGFFGGKKYLRKLSRKMLKKERKKTQKLLKPFGIKRIEKEEPELKITREYKKKKD